MRKDWEEIVDTARGLASEETQESILSDAEAASKVELLKKVVEAREEVDEMWLARAKSLLPVATPQVWVGRLVLAPGQLAYGFRSEMTTGTDLEYVFDNAQLSLRIEPIAAGKSLTFVGAFIAEPTHEVQVSVGGKTLTTTDEFGQFAFEAPAAIDEIQFLIAQTNEIFVVQLP